jgi:hypothetical protein
LNSGIQTHRQCDRNPLACGASLAAGSTAVLPRHDACSVTASHDQGFRLSFVLGNVARSCILYRHSLRHERNRNDSRCRLRFMRLVFARKVRNMNTSLPRHHPTPSLTRALVALVAASLFAPPAFSANTFPASGPVGIGTTSPQADLDVVGFIRATTITSIPTSGAGCEMLYAGGVAIFQSFNRSTSTYTPIQFSGSSWELDILGAPKAFMTTAGNLGVGTISPAAKLDVNGNANFTGNVTVSGNIAAKYQDVAEWVSATAPLEPGTVVVLNPDKQNEVMPSERAYDTAVAGVVSASPGLILGEASPSKEKIATIGRVRVKVDASQGPIHTGDLLVTSAETGTAMRSEPVEVAGIKIHRPGTILGKALEPILSGKGEILVLLTLQ